MNLFETLKEVAKVRGKLLLGRGVFKSYSQNGEDVAINLLTKKVKEGFYVDIGGFHPVQYSNTYALYKKGWEGLIIEPNPRARSLFALIRPKDDFIEAGVGREKGNLTYYCFQDPAYNTLDDVQARKWQESGIKLTETLTVPVRTLSEILQERKVSKIDVLSIDAEGMDFDILQSHDWTIPTDIVVVENHEFDLNSSQNNPMYEFLISKSYRLNSKLGFSLIFESTRK